MSERESDYTFVIDNQDVSEGTLCVCVVSLFYLKVGCCPVPHIGRSSLRLKENFHIPVLTIEPVKWPGSSSNHK